MIIKDYTIAAPEGMHARPATALVRLARQFQSTISMKKGAKEVKMNSLLNVLSMGVKGGEVVTVSLDGTDEAGCGGGVRSIF
ncbi:HPr family phosphocarrier protein [Puia sp. P3]|uniref:HPr family phosphocarrier protein n=1 Tax=Puia sp. P3 TaxID=3423952 RepID=UPI003D668304